MFDGVNFWAVVVSAFVGFIMGGFWYSKPLFGEVWKKEDGANDKQLKKNHTPVVFGIAFVLYFISALAFAVFIGGSPDLLLSIIAGVGTGLFFVATSFGINYLFGGRSVKLLLIDGGYHVVQFTIYGLILGLWH